MMAEYPKVENWRMALLLAVLTVMILMVTVRDIGLTWDEPTYIVAAKTYPGWYGELLVRPGYALSDEGVTAFWAFNYEHPPLSKVWSGFVWLGARYFFDDLTAHRLGNILLAAMLIALLYSQVATEYGLVAGLVAAAALLTMPRFFFHAQLAALDVPVALMIFAVTYLFWLGRNRTGWVWTLLLGLVWGLALATKINALFIPPIVLTVWTLLFRPRRYLMARLALAGVVGVVFFFVSWPWFYHDSLNRLLSYLGFLTLERYTTEQYYFGQLYAAPHTPLPWHYPFVTIAVVVPFSLLLLAAAGAYNTMGHKSQRPLGGLLLLGAFASLLVLSSRWGQPFDNERLLMPVFPYVAALAGIGFVAILSTARRLAEERKIFLAQRPLVTLLAVLAFAPHVVAAADLYPHLLSYYSEAIGGAYGARALRLETTYWCESYSKTLPYFNSHAPPEAVLWAECQDVLIYYQLQGKLRPDLQIANGPEAKTVFSGARLNPATFQEADFIVIQNRQSGHYRALRQWIVAHEPVHQVNYRRLRLIEVYKQDMVR
jgi:4-amino-4-deoxy-L-arabinose transferase-like glycosyltransferase